MASRGTRRGRRNGGGRRGGKFGLLSMGSMIGALVSIFMIGILPFGGSLKSLFSTVIIYGLLAKTVPGLRGLFGALIMINVLQSLFNFGGTTGSGTSPTALTTPFANPPTNMLAPLPQ